QQPRPSPDQWPHSHRCRGAPPLRDWLPNVSRHPPTTAPACGRDWSRPHRSLAVDRALRHVLRDVDLRLAIDCDLGVVRLQKPSLLFMIGLWGSVKFFCALGSGVVEGGTAGRPDFLRSPASRWCCASATALSLTRPPPSPPLPIRPWLGG